MTRLEGQTEPGPEGALITIPGGNSLPTWMGNHYRPRRGTLKPIWGKEVNPVGRPAVPARDTIKTVKISLWRHENRQNISVEGENSKTSHVDMKTYG